jgi:hypothetical protein
MSEDGKLPLKIYYLPIALFFASIFLRLSINGFNLPHPGDLKSVDAFLHAVNTDWVATSHQITKAPPYLAFGHKDVVFFHPPILYLIPAAMTMWTGLESHNTVWFFAAFVSALPILILYIIGDRVFNSKAVGILSSALFVLPATNPTSFLMPQIFRLYWLYPSYIGLWNVTVGKTLFVVQLWLIWELWNKPRGWVSLLLGITTGAQVLSHIPETVMIMPLIAAAYIQILKKDFKGNLRHLLLFSFPTGVSFIAFLPKLLGVWLKTKPIAAPGAAPQLLDAFYFLEIFWTSTLVLYVVGLLLLLYRWRENRYWLGVNVYVLLWLGVVPLFFTNVEYFGKLRFVVPFVAFPVAAFGAARVIDLAWKKTPLIRCKEGYKKAIFAYAVLIFIVSGLPQYNVMKQRMLFEELTTEKYDAMLWIQENTAKDSKILLIDGFNIASGLYSKRVTFQRNWSEYTDEIEDFENGGYHSMVFYGRWLEELHNLPYERSFFSYGYHHLPESPVSTDSFDYAVMWDFSEKAKRYNAAIKASLSTAGFKTVYEKESIVIMEKIR